MLLAVAGVGLDQQILIWAAIGVLGISVIVRIIMRRAAAQVAPPREDDRSTP
jgi:hypothetical protein